MRNLNSALSRIVAWSKTVNWPITLWRWSCCIASTAVLATALGFFVVDCFLYSLLFAHGLLFDAGWGSVYTPDAQNPIPLKDAIEQMKFIFELKILSTLLALGFLVPVGRRVPETAYKRISVLD